jgi:Holliday junction resolvasome RuvABC endonuclease subunit
MGVDPGMACTGIAVITMPELVPPRPKLELVKLKLVRTEKASKKVLRETRMTGDDQRRLRDVWNALQGLYDEYRPVVIGVEAYTPWVGRMGGNAWKVALSYQLVCCFGWHVGVEPFVFLPGDLKRIFVGQKGASKGDVAAAIAEKVVGVREQVADIAKTMQEHVTDAIAHAYLAAEELVRMRQMLHLGNE